MRFRPCIDLHDGVVKQIVGATLSDEADNGPTINYKARKPAAWFADPIDGAQLLICSEIGSEGRNFQFAHHLILFDLPLNPDLLEQRIGRLDRIGQTETIHIHVPYLEHSAQAILFRWYQEGLAAFEHTCPAGHAVFVKVKDALLAALQSPGDDDAIERLVAEMIKMSNDDVEIACSSPRPRSMAVNIVLT